MSSSSAASVGALSISSVGSSDSGSDDDEEDRVHDREYDRRGVGGMSDRVGGVVEEESSSSSDDDDDDHDGGDTFFAPDELDATPVAAASATANVAKRSGDGSEGVAHNGVAGDVDNTGACGGSGEDDPDDGGKGSVGDGGGNDGDGGGDGGEGVEVGTSSGVAGPGGVDDEASCDAEATGGRGAPAAAAPGETASSSGRDEDNSGHKRGQTVAAKSDDPSVVGGTDDGGGGGGDGNRGAAPAPATVRTGSRSSTRRHDGRRKKLDRDVVEIEIGRSVLAWQKRRHRRHGVTDGEESSPTREDEDESSYLPPATTTVVTVRHGGAGAPVIASDHGKGATTTVATLVLDRDDSSTVDSSSRRATVRYHGPNTHVDDDAGGRSTPGAGVGGDEQGDKSGHDEGSSSLRVNRRYYVGRASIVAPPPNTTGDASSHGEGEGGEDGDGDDTMVECVALYDTSLGSYVLEIVDVAITDLEAKKGWDDHPDPVTFAKADGGEEEVEEEGDEDVDRVRTTGGGLMKGATGGKSMGRGEHDENRSDPLRRTEAAERRVMDLRRRKGRMPSTVTSKVKAKANAKKSPAKKTAQKKTGPKRKKFESEIKLDREDVVASADAANGVSSATEVGARDEDADSTANTNTNPAAASSSSRRTKHDEDGKATRSSPSPPSPAITSGDKKRRQRRRGSPSSAEGETATEEASQRQQSRRRGAKGPPSTLASSTPRKKPKSGYWGVTTAVSKRGGGRCSYRCQVKLGGRLRYLGTFDSAEEAARRYDAAAYRRGDGALLNFPDDIEATLRSHPVVEGQVEGGKAVTAAADGGGDEGGGDGRSPEEG